MTSIIIDLEDLFDSQNLLVLFRINMHTIHSEMKLAKWYANTDVTKNHRKLCNVPKHVKLVFKEGTIIIKSCVMKRWMMDPISNYIYIYIFIFIFI